MWLPYSLVFILVTLRQVDGLCDSIRPRNEDFVNAAITQDSTNPTRFSISTENSASGLFRAIRENSSCPLDCTVRLEGQKPYGSSGSILYLPSLSSLSASGQSTIICAQSRGFCGADTPIHRHYRLSSDGIQHAYSLNGAHVEGYLIELIALCYVWSGEDGSFPASTATATSSQNPLVEMMRPMGENANLVALEIKDSTIDGDLQASPSPKDDPNNRIDETSK